MHRNKPGILGALGPGIVIAATGVGAGDLVAAAVCGAVFGTRVLWAVLAGALLKFVLNEGLARWQLATGSTLLEGCVAHFGRPVQWLFLAYLLIWSYFVASALMSACGATACRQRTGRTPKEFTELVLRVASRANLDRRRSLPCQS
jgi:Mn2+/Fe2+ NRAMP family transporter